MPYKQNSDLPGSVVNILPMHAQDIYREAFNSAWDEYREPRNRRGEEGHEEVAHKVAWRAVKNKYHKEDDGKWHPTQGS